MPTKRELITSIMDRFSEYAIEHRLPILDDAEKIAKFRSDYDITFIVGAVKKHLEPPFTEGGRDYLAGFLELELERLKDLLLQKGDFSLQNYEFDDAIKTRILDDVCQVIEIINR